ncbi:anaphase promoting complex subunit protein [Rutstroemia sp. NJR-2017a WRK4]|nr:anaphase promoting complex subunit protein [Rutstroemia sp. NJR-2017a WRK4]
MSTSIPIPPPPADTDPPAPSPSNPSSIPRFSTSPLSTDVPSIQTELFPSISADPTPEPEDAANPTAPMVPARPATFAPFFTLISDATNTNTDTDSPTTHHPARIHYLFSDDDTEALIDACVRASQGARVRSEALVLGGESEGAEDSPATGGASSQSGLEEVPRRGKGDAERGVGRARTSEREREERVILIDMAASGDAVVRAQSLSEKWQVTNCEVGKAPIWEEGAEGEGEEKGIGRGGGGLMLRIEGTGIWKDEEVVGLGLLDTGMFGKGRGKEKDGDQVELDMEKLLEDFDKKMGVLRKVLGGVGWGAGNEEAVGNEEGAVDDVAVEDVVVELENEREMNEAL